MSFDPYQKLAQIVENVNSRSAEGEEGAAPQIDAPSFDLEKRNAYLEQQILELEAQLRRTERAYADLAESHAMLGRLYDLECEANLALMGEDDKQDDYTVEILPTRH
jgi:hypothetical protein